MGVPHGLQADIYSWGMCVLSLDQGIANPPDPLEQQRAVGMSMQHVCNTSPLLKFWPFPPPALHPPPIVNSGLRPKPLRT